MGSTRPELRWGMVDGGNPVLLQVEQSYPCADVRLSVHAQNVSSS